MAGPAQVPSPPPAAFHARPRPRLPVSGPVLAAAVYVLLHAAWLAGQWGGAEYRTVIADAFIVPNFLAVALATWRTARCAALPAHVRRGWRWLTAAYGLLWVGNVVWTYRDLVPGTAWLVPWGKLFIVLSYAPLLTGLLALPSTRRTRSEAVRFWLDVATLLLGAGLVVGVVTYLAGGAPSGTYAILEAFVTPAADVAIIGATAAVLLGRLDGSSRAALRLLGAGHALSVVAGVVAVWYGRDGSVVPGHWVDGLWMLSSVLLFVAADVQYRRAARTDPALPHDDAGAPRPARPGDYSLLPYVGVALAYAVLFAVARPWWGRPAGVVVLGTAAVTALVVARQVLALRDNRRLAAERVAQDAHFRELIEHSSDVVCVVDAEGVARFVSPSAERVFGYAADAALGASVLALVHRDDAGRAREALARAAANTAPEHVELRVRHGDGRWRVAAVSAGRLRRGAGGAGEFVLNVRDVTARVEAEAELARRAFQDPLTGLANRALFRDRAEHAIARGPRGGGRVAVLLLDLDNFKSVNDTLGHAAGDELLLRVAERLLNATRGCDTVARLGGDEFAVLLGNGAGEDDALVVAHRVLASLARPVAVVGREVLVRASVGVAASAPGEGTAELLRNADVAMYRAKARGKATVEVFAPEMYADLHDRLALESALAHALDRGEFRLVYQPIVELSTGRAVGAEALLRWDHPERGEVPPGTFVPLAEESGLIARLGRWALEEACRDAATWRAAAAGAPACGAAPCAAPYVAVNISGRQMQGAQLVADVQAALAGAGLPADALVLEITEGVVMHDTEVSLRRLHELKALGVRLAIDDFGTGYSSLAYLQRFPVDVLKIDKAFVDGVAGAGSDAALTRTIIALGETLGLRTVAEGVETAAQQAALRSLGCDLGQGYLFARPLRPAEFGRLLTTPGTADAA